MRVLYVIDSLASGGEQRQLVTLVNALDRRVVEPEVAIYHPLDHFRPELERTGTRIHRLGTHGGRDPLVLVRLARLIRNGRFDLIHTRLKTSGVLARVATMVGRRPAIVLSEGGVDLDRSRTRLLLERVLCNRADAMIVNAERIRRHVEELVPGLRGRVRLVPNGVDWTEPSAETRRAASALRATYLKNNDELLLGSVGRLDQAKNPLLLVDAIAQLPRDVLDRIRLMWVGAQDDEELLARVRARIESKGLEARVVLVPPTQRIRTIYLAIDGLVLSSVSEGLPNAVLEAMMHGKPVVATDVGDLSDVVQPGRTGWLVRAGSAPDLASAIGQFMRSPREELFRMGAAASDRVRENYSTALLADRTMAVYREVLAMRKHAEDEPRV